jgi:hypothetical protein
MSHAITVIHIQPPEAWQVASDVWWKSADVGSR